jgi:geranylgeranyl diphosphate synthase type I
MLIDGRPRQRPTATTTPRTTHAATGAHRPTGIATLATEPLIHDHLRKVDAVLKTAITEAVGDWETTINLPGLLDDLIAAGGKRLRPMVGCLGFWISGGRAGTPAEQELVRIGAAFELLHSFALVQDDVMDQSSSRRGRPTVHVRLARQHRDTGAAGSADRFGESMAVLLGDLAHAEANRLMAGCQPELQRRWHRMIIELINGQVRDIAGAAGRERDPQRALLVGRLKSGGYTIPRPLELGAVAAGADQRQLAVLADCGTRIGTAFALRDDVLGIWGDPTATGKPAGDDLVAGKPTVIMALAQDRLPPTTRRLLDRAGTDDLTDEDIRVLQQAIADCGVRDEVEKMIIREVEAAVAAIGGLDGPAEATAALIRLARDVAWRER